MYQSDVCVEFDYCTVYYYKISHGYYNNLVRWFIRFFFGHTSRYTGNMSYLYKSEKIYSGAYVWVYNFL